MSAAIESRISSQTQTARHFSVGAIGLSNVELEALQDALHSDVSDACTYRITAFNEERALAGQSFDIHLIGYCNAANIMAWQKIARRKSYLAAKPVIRLVSRQAPNPNGYFLQPPLTAAAVRAVFDTYVEMELPEPNTETAAPPKTQRQSVDSDGHLQPHTYNRVMVVDDNLSVRLMLESQLQSRGVHTHLFDDSQTALKAAKKNRYDAIFIDTSLPHLNGFHLCKEIRQDFFNRITPIILLNSAVTTLERIKAKMAGGTACLNKPLRANDLLTITNQIYQASA